MSTISISKLLITAVTIAASGSLAVAQTSDAGTVKVNVRADSSFDSYTSFIRHIAIERLAESLTETNMLFDSFTSSPSSSVESWFRNKIYRMEVSSPYFDGRTGWYPDGWAYIVRDWRPLDAALTLLLFET